MGKAYGAEERRHLKQYPAHIKKRLETASIQFTEGRAARSFFEPAGSGGHRGEGSDMRVTFKNVVSDIGLSTTEAEKLRGQIGAL
ncbi:MAG: hypothetical protein ABWY00_09745, partial [Dongiaceae bacterium]